MEHHGRTRSDLCVQPKWSPDDNSSQFQPQQRTAHSPVLLLCRLPGNPDQQEMVYIDQNTPENKLKFIFPFTLKQFQQ